MLFTSHNRQLCKKILSIYWEDAIYKINKAYFGLFKFWLTMVCIVSKSVSIIVHTSNLTSTNFKQTNPSITAQQKSWNPGSSVIVTRKLWLFFQKFQFHLIDHTDQRKKIWRIKVHTLFSITRFVRFVPKSHNCVRQKLPVVLTQLVVERVSKSSDFCGLCESNLVKYSFDLVRV